MSTKLELLNQTSPEKRLAALREIAADCQVDFPERDPRYINNHIHTIYSFSPYSPTAAAYMAAQAGLCTAGIIDHDSIAGAKEFLAAGQILDLPVTCGFEMRVSWLDSPFAGRRINNPDQDGVAYMTMQGVAARYFDQVEDFLQPYREKRNLRNRAMVAKLNDQLSPDMQIDFDRDVLPLSEAKDKGSVTERHLMFALAKKVAERLGRGQPTIQFLEDQGVQLTDKQRSMLEDTAYPFYEYDVLGILKSSFVPQIFIPAGEELCSLRDFVDLARKVEAIACYAYLGDVTDSVTGDKAAQKFEDDYLDDLLTYLDKMGVEAVTYMPARNTPAQIERLQGLCQQHNKFQISGEDINSPRQNFICHAMEKPEFAGLIDSTWALIAQEREVEAARPGFFSAEMIARYPEVSDRIAHFRSLLKG